MAMEAGEMRGPGVEAAADDDAGWFEAHPDRHLRLRDRIPGEYEAHQVTIPPPGLVPRTLVIQPQPGVRLRQPVAVYAHVNHDELSDAQLFAFFEESASFEIKQMVSKLRKVKMSGKPRQRGQSGG